MKLRSLLMVMLLWIASAGWAQQITDLQRAQRIYELLQEAQGDSVMAYMNDQVRAAVSPQMLSSMFAELQTQLGALKEVSDWQEDEMYGVKVCFRDLSFEKMALRLLLSFDADGRANTLRFVPVPTTSEGPKAVSEVPDGVREKAVEVCTGSFRLPGTLSFPAEGNQFPLVVLVHGSGPCDRDETVGGMKVFRDLAHGLARKGIAVLRYDKRTKVYGGRSVAPGQTLDFDSEVTEDAVSALRLAASLPQVDSTRLFVLGHSLGGMLVPRILQRAGSGKVSGGIILAGPARPLEELLEEQISYLASLQGTAGADVEMQMDAVMASMPESYRNLFKSYRPQEDAAGLSLPLLILQGERDYQVTMQDFENWRSFLKDQPEVEFKSYPRLNHLLQEGEGKSVPSEYEAGGHVPSYVIDDLAAFINKH